MGSRSTLTFGRRFGPGVRMWATAFVLIYLIGYVGVNLFTMGKVLNALVGWEIPAAAFLVAVISCTYVTAGGQTSVIMTDLLQGVMLLFTGALILFLGIDYLRPCASPVREPCPRGPVPSTR